MKPIPTIARQAGVKCIGCLGFRAIGYLKQRPLVQSQIDERSYHLFA